MFNQKKSRMELNQEDIENCKKILSRGLHFYNRIGPQESYKIYKDRDLVPEWCFCVRALAEITEGMSRWFDSIENIKKLAEASSLDLDEMFWTLTKQANKYEQDLGPIYSQIDVNSHKSEQLKYPTHNASVQQHRRREHIFPNTNKFTSKIAHQDEFSLIAFNIEAKGLKKNLFNIAAFWRADFRNQICLLKNRLPKIIEHLNQSNIVIPFDFSELSKKEEDYNFEMS